MARPLPGIGDLYDFGDCLMIRRPRQEPRPQPAIGYKLLTLRKDGTLGPLFIDRRKRIPIGVWMRAEVHPTKGYAFRPGWHILATKEAPHLSKKGRVWAKVEFRGGQSFVRPKSQGGLWYLAEEMRVVSIES